jgi:drug/metabolite transporter (DMT)-like permease
MMVVWVIASGHLARLGELRRRSLLFRGVLEASIATAFVTALGALPLADITAILLMAPLLITALSMIVFGEQVGWRRWSAVVVGFIGMLMVVRPGGATLPLVPLLLALASVVGVALRDLMTRKMPADIPTVLATTTSTLGTLVGGLILVGLGGEWRPISPTIALSLAAAAGFVVVGNYAIVEACREAELAVVSPFRYTVIVWAVILGFLVFGEWPVPLAMGGIALIVGSGIYTLHRERIRRRAA